MSFDPFESKEANAIIKKLCKGKSLKPFESLFKKVVAAKMSIDNLEPGGVSCRLSDECLALAEVVAAGRGQGKVDLPVVVEKWFENAPEFDDALAKSAKAAVDKVRTQSGAWAIAQEMGGWPAWTSFCRGLSTRLGKAPKKRKAPKKTEGPAAIAKLLRSLSCDMEKEGDEIVWLSASDGQVTDEVLGQIAELKTLRTLLLTEQPLTDRGLPALSSLKKLEVFTLVNCDVKGRGFKDLVLPRLRKWSFGRTGVNAALKNFASLNKVREAQFRISDLTDAGLKCLAAATALETLHVSYCEKLKGTGFRELKSLKKLRAIVAREIAFSPAGFAALCDLGSLTYLSLCDAKLPAKSISSLGELQKLKTLDLSGVGASDRQVEFLADLRKLTSLNLSKNPKVTDQTVAMVSKLPALDALYLAGTGVTEASLETLRGMKRLKTIGLYNTAVSEKEKKKLERELDKKA